jgi:uncharacterized RDD family membrane protein YckC
VSEVNWYYAKDGVQLGPVPIGQLRDMARMGTLQPNDLVWTEGMPEWRPASAVQAVFATAMAPAPPGVMPYGGGAAAPGYFPGPGTGGLNYYSRSDEFAYAGFWLRFCAAFIDGIIVGIPLFGIGALLVVGLGLHEDFGNQNSPVPALLDLGFRLIYLLVAWIYSAVQESGPHMATFGKRACGIVVTDLNGQRISFGRASGRFFGEILSGITCYVGYIMAGFTEKSQALHDMVAGTLVVRKSQ